MSGTRAGMTYITALQQKCCNYVLQDSIAKAFGTYGRLLSLKRGREGFLRTYVKWGMVWLPDVLERFISAYDEGAYPELTGPIRLEQRLYEIQSEIDLRAFALSQWYFHWRRRAWWIGSLAVLWLGALTFSRC